MGLKSVNKDLAEENKGFITEVNSLNAQIKKYKEDTSSMQKDRQRAKKLVEDNTFLKMQLEGMSKQHKKKQAECEKLDFNLSMA